jgi:hypothetical protein
MSLLSQSKPENEQTTYFPQSHILRALIRVHCINRSNLSVILKAVKDEVELCKERYGPVFKSLRRLLDNHDDRPAEAFAIFKRTLGNRKDISTQLWTNSLTSTASFRQNDRILLAIDKELKVLRTEVAENRVGGISHDLVTWLERYQARARENAGNALFRDAVQRYEELHIVSDQVLAFRKLLGLTVEFDFARPRTSDCEKIE